MISRWVQSSIVHVGFAFVMMGSWALYANWGHPMPKPLMAALLQGALSGLITFALKRSLDILRRIILRTRGWWLPPVIACSASFCLLAGAHIAAGTPEILRTVSVPFCVASLYAFGYNLIMWRRTA